jgi:hypothetical protein
MLVKSLALLFLIPTALSGAPVDLVKLGKETFHALGCAECHSEIKDDTSVKTGPGIFGLFQKNPRKRDIIDPGENHKHTVTADLAYFTKSLRQPATEIAISESGATKGTTFLPVMPGYPEALIGNQKALAIFHYLQTLNENSHRGPAQVMAELEEGTQIKDIHQDPAEILVTDRTRIFRARIAGSSARAVYVGMPSGLNYAFDPRTLSISKAWWGGFLNLKQEMSGRGNRVSTPGHQASEITLAGLDDIDGHEIDLSFKSPLIGDEETIANNLHGEADFRDQLKDADAQFLGYQYSSDPKGPPTFLYQIGPDKFALTFEISSNGLAKSKIMKNGKESVATFKTDDPDKIWRPNAIPSVFTQKIALTPMAGMALLPGYSAERVPAPTDPHGRPQLFEPMGMITDTDGSIVVTTRTAGIWRLKDNTWTMIAEGFLDALGVIIEKDRLIIGQKPEITELRDQNGDGFYETSRTLSDDFLFTENYHEYLHGPAKGTDGNYYYLLNLSHRDGRPIHKANGNFMGSQGGYRGWAMQVTPDGKTTPFAYGLRSPAGLATGPDGRIYYTENQGEYNGTSKLHLLKKDAYYGHPSSLVDLPGMKPDSPEIAWDKWSAKAEPALALMAHSRVANSPGSPAWDTTGGKFGPFAGDMFVGDQTLSNLFRILPRAGHKSAVIPFAKGFPSGVMRLCFDQKGALYVGQTGRGWRARGGSEHALVKLSHQDSPEPLLKDITRDGETFTFYYTGDVSKLAKSMTISVESWFYHDKPDYGSPENNKLRELVLKPTFDQEKKTFSFSLAPNPKRNKGSRVFRFHNLPDKDFPEAFYTISK